MRETLFRGLDVMTGSWVYGNHVKTGEGLHFIIPQNSNEILLTRVDEDTVGEFTGLRDKNAKKIYEWDAIKNDRGTVLIVKFVDGAFYAEGTDAISKSHVFSNLSDFSSWSTVIGDIYKNPELLEVAK